MMSNDNSDDTIEFDIEDIFEEEVIQEIEIEEFELDEILPDSVDDDEDDSVSSESVSSKSAPEKSVSSESVSSASLSSATPQSEDSVNDSASDETTSDKSAPNESLGDSTVADEAKPSETTPSETTSNDLVPDEPKSGESDHSQPMVSRPVADEPKSNDSAPSKPSDSESGSAEPVSPKSQPSEPSADDSASDEAESDEPTSSDAKPAESAPSESSSGGSVSDQPNSSKSATVEQASNGSDHHESISSESALDESKKSKSTSSEMRQNQSGNGLAVLEPETSNQESQTVTEEAEPFVEVTEIAESVVPSEETKAEVERRIMSASQELDSLVRDVVQQDSNSLAATELDIMQAKNYLSMHKLRRAKTSVKRAEKALVNLEEDVLYLRRSIAMLHRLLKEKKIDRIEAENILLGLRKATSAAEIGDVGQAATEIEFLVDDLIGGNTSTLNPFFFRHFWLGVDTRWPAGGDTGVLLVRLINDGPIAMPAMRLSPPVPEGWSSIPTSVDLPIIAPGGNLPLRFDIKSEGRYGADEIPLSRKLAVSTGYEMRSGEIMVTIRAQNRSMEPLNDIVLSPWLPPGYTTAKVPFVERLSPDEVAVIRMPLTIDMGVGGRS